MWDRNNTGALVFVVAAMCFHASPVFWFVVGVGLAVAVTIFMLENGLEKHG